MLSRVTRAISRVIFSEPDNNCFIPAPRKCIQRDVVGCVIGWQIENQACCLTASLFNEPSREPLSTAHRSFIGGDFQA